ncbi:hypothetical protein NKH77_05070 [Streptomyces sp. M19]
MTPTGTPHDARCSCSCPLSSCSARPSCRERTRPTPALRSDRKGVSVTDVDGASGALADVGASWYYDWSPPPATSPSPTARSSCR